MNDRRPLNTWLELRSERSRNWLALALLLAAWNVSDNDAVRNGQAGGEAGRHGVMTARLLRGQGR
ncbi:MAG: hypothetical protein U1F35_09100 [Steroidobacteraceae bacterium]